VQPIDFGRAGELITESLAGSRAFLEALEAGGAEIPRHAQLQGLLPHEHEAVAGR
jgi:hypothetical protein